jgi:hypothetical protein
MRLNLSFHPDLGLLAQRGRELLLQDDAATHRGVFRSIVDLQTAINAYLAEHNASPKPFVWTQSAEIILAKLDRLRLPVTSLCVSALVQTGTAPDHSVGPLKRQQATHTTTVRQRKINIREECYSGDH